jgi:hypothetical protein
MADNSIKRCPRCSGEIDTFGTCRRCGREWSETLDPEELAVGLPEGQQHPPEAPKKIGKRQSRSRFTKSKDVAERYAGWQIDANQDDETEIIRKRSLMHLDSRKTYNALGLAIRAKAAQNGALLWLSRLWEFLSDEEQKVLAPTMERLKRGFADIQALTEIKTFEAAEMEKALDKAHHSARQARLRINAASRNNIQPGQDTEGFAVPTPVAIDPKLLVDPALTQPKTKEEMIEEAQQALRNLDQEKALKKRMDLNRNENPDETEEA